MTVLLDLTPLCTEVRHYGIGRYLRDLAHGLAPRAPAVVAVSALPLFGAATIERDLDRAVAGLCAAPIERHGRWAWRARLRLGAAKQRARAALLHAGHPESTPLVPARRVVTCHDLIPLRLPQHYLRGSRARQLAGDCYRYRAAEHVIAISQATADDLVRVVGVPARRISVVHLGVDLAAWSPEPAAGDAESLRRLGLCERGYALYVGADDWRKNFEGMLRALAALRRSGSELVLAWAGRPVPRRREAIEAQARALGVRSAFLVLGHVDDRALAALYRGAAALLFVSRLEGFGYPLVEAMACGCPVVATAGSSLAEIGGDAALLVDPDAPEAIAARLRALEDGAERRRAVTRGLERARRFTLARMADETFAVYARLGHA